LSKTNLNFYTNFAENGKLPEDNVVFISTKYGYNIVNIET
jgi:hypothetical protein